MKRGISKLVFGLVLAYTLTISGVTALAGDLNALTTTETVAPTEGTAPAVNQPVQQNTQDTTSGSGTATDRQLNSNLTDVLGEYQPITQENIEKGAVIANPIVNLIGNFIGCVILIAVALIGGITALDLLYIGVPFTRRFLNPNYGLDGAASGAMSGGGMMGGGMMNRGMMNRGMMGGGMMGGAQGGMTASPRRICWVSDEAVDVINITQPQQGQQMQGNMGMPMGQAMGGMMGGQQPMNDTPGGAKSGILMYLKKRTFFIIVFSLATVLLTSSVLLDSGINIAELIIKVTAKINDAISGVGIA